MSHLVVLNLGKGNWQQGLPTVIAQLWEAHSTTPMQVTGSLPAMPELDALYRRWQMLYEALYSNLGWRRPVTRQFGFEIDEADITHISQAEFDQLCHDLQNCLNTWLSAAQFQKIDRQLRTRLAPTDEIRFIVVADDPQLLKLPWSLWDFLRDYPRAEIALSPPEYIRPVRAGETKPGGKVKILAILGDSQGINVAQDQQLLQRLPNVELKFLVEPEAKNLNQQLWEPGWDVLFFAGHSSSQGKGQIQLNQTESLTIEQLKYGLRNAIAHGLKLAIFNSCDGLGLAQDLADLYLPQVIVMREPVPDRIAQEFLKHFLTAFSTGHSLYPSVREAREKLQAMETEFPCASWLPVICQNPAEVPPTWQEWVGIKQSWLRLPTRQELQTVLLSSVVITGLMTGVRSAGWLQPLEIGAFDRLMRLRPTETSDSRLLVVTVTEQDIQAQGAEPRRGSLSDRTLNRLLAALEKHQPRAIGLDIYRDFSASQPDLATRMRHNKSLIAICKHTDPESDSVGISPPPEIPQGRLGFSDFVQDSDGVIRRHLLFFSPNSTSPCTTPYSLSFQLAFRYLSANGILPRFTPDKDLQLGNVVFHKIRNGIGKYRSNALWGSQIFLNYRSSPSPGTISQRVTLAQVLNGEVNPNAIKDRIILVGVAAPNTSGDYWSTPYGTEFNTRLPGVLIHAQMVSQMLSAVLDKRPLLQVWSLWVEIVWIGTWSLLGAVLSWSFRRLSLLSVTVGVTCGTLIGLCFILLIQGRWVPLMPSAIALLLTSASVAYVFSQSQQRAVQK